jgi:NADH/NAD ratio-sensing transcriptional regulator Rex
VKGLLNFAPVVLRVPPHVSVVHVDLTVQLEQLAFLVQLSASE